MSLRIERPRVWGLGPSVVRRLNQGRFSSASYSFTAEAATTSYSRTSGLTYSRLNCRMFGDFSMEAVRNLT